MAESVLLWSWFCAAVTKTVWARTDAARQAGHTMWVACKRQYMRLILCQPAPEDVSLEANRMKRAVAGLFTTADNVTRMVIADTGRQLTLHLPRSRPSREHTSQESALTTARKRAQDLPSYQEQPNRAARTDTGPTCNKKKNPGFAPASNQATSMYAIANTYRGYQ